MKVLFINHNHLDTNSGIHVFNLANHLTRLGVECIVCIPNLNVNDTAKEIGTALFDVVSFDEARRNHENRKIDIIHAWTPREVVRSMTEELAGVYKCPYVVHLEDNEEALLEANLGKSFAEISRLSPERLDLIIPKHLSHPIRYKEFLDNACGISVIIDTLREFCPPELPSEVIWPGYEDEIDWLIPFDDKLRQQFGIASGEHVIVYTGGMHFANRQEVSSLYLAIGLLNRKGIRTRIVRTGKDHIPLFDKPMLEVLKDYCIHLGHVSRKELPAILSLADVLVQPGKSDQFNDYRFPSKLPEYLATSKPVLLPATNIGRYLRDGEECILLQQGHALEIAQKLEMLFQDSDLRKKIGIAGRHFAEQNLRWGQSAAKLKTFYQHLLNPNKLEITMPQIKSEEDRSKWIDEMIPPAERIFVGDGDFKTVGEDFKKHFIELGELKPDAKVLDVGCGIGRMAVPLTQYLSSQGEYWGFDIVKDGINWCVEKITSRFPNFHFQLSDVHNKEYNPNGKFKAVDYKFPYQDGSFDFVFLTSVFTHMLPKDLENYLSEIARVLKPGGKCFITYFLLNSESMSLIEQGATSQKFLYEVDGCLTVDKDNPELSLAYPETTIKNLYRKYGLEIIEPIHYGYWCHRKEFLSYQDIVVATLSITTNQHLLAPNRLEIIMPQIKSEEDRSKWIDEMIPPEERIIIGGGDFKTVGEGFKKHFIELADLKPDAKVLDVGCGIGRMAVPLTQYLSSQGEYWGFDIVKDGIDWCVEKITSRFPNFHFQLSDVHNKQYNPNGKFKAVDYKFPYQDGSFDFVFLTSVFTHMLPKDLENYLSEIARVLKPGGKCFITYFLLNPESTTLIEQGATSQKFLYEVDDCLTVDKDNPEYALAYPETSIKNLYRKYGLEIIEPIHYGNWCHRKEFLSYQDIVVATLSITTNVNTTKGVPSIQRQPGKSIPILGYATVRDYCDSADHFSQVMRFDGDLKDVQRPWMIKSILRMIPRGAKLLEIGGGEPLVANALQKLGYDVTIIDPYDGAGNGPQTYAQYVKAYPHVKIIRSYFDKNIPVPVKTFDCIFSISVLEHVPHVKLQDVFTGILKFLKPGGCSIHCTDLVIAGHMADWHNQGVREMLFWQIKLQSPHLDEDQFRQKVDEMFEEYYQNMADDLETYYHSAQGHNVWRGGMPYDEFPFRKIVSMQSCAIKT